MTRALFIHSPLGEKRILYHHPSLPNPKMPIFHSVNHVHLWLKLWFSFVKGGFEAVS
jgi:hypothetical protein